MLYYKFVYVQRTGILYHQFSKAPVILGLNVGDLLLYLLSCHYIKCLGCFVISHVCLKDVKHISRLAGTFIYISATITDMAMSFG